MIPIKNVIVIIETSFLNLVMMNKKTADAPTILQGNNRLHNG